MTAPSNEPSNGSNLLRYALRGNALFSASSGAGFILAAGHLASLTGLQPPLIFTIAGIGLIGYAGPVWRLAASPAIPPAPAWAIILADAAWVAGSLALLLSGIAPLTVMGKWLIAILADIVGIFAVLQYIGLQRLSAHIRAIEPDH